MRGAVRAGLRVVFHGRALRALVAVELVWGAGLVGVELLSGPRLAELFDDPEQGVVTLGITAAVAWSISGAGSAGTRWLVRRSGSPARAGIVTRIAQGAAVAIMAVAAGPAGLVAGYLAFYLVHGVANSVHYGMVHRLVGPDERATVLSVSSLTARVGGTAADVGFGALAAGAGIGAAFWVSAALLVSGAPLYAIAGRAMPVQSMLERHALGQREIARVVDRVGGPTHVTLPGVRAGLAAAAGLLLATEGAADLGAGRPDVDVGDAAVGADRPT